MGYYLYVAGCYIRICGCCSVLCVGGWDLWLYFNFIEIVGYYTRLLVSDNVHLPRLQGSMHW